LNGQIIVKYLSVNRPRSWTESSAPFLLWAIKTEALHGDSQEHDWYADLSDYFEIDWRPWRRVLSECTTLACADQIKGIMLPVFDLLHHNDGFWHHSPVVAIALCKSDRNLLPCRFLYNHPHISQKKTTSENRQAREQKHRCFHLVSHKIRMINQCCIDTRTV
jgi:hypothetical protein